MDIAFGQVSNDHQSVRALPGDQPPEPTLPSGGSRMCPPSAERARPFPPQRAGALGGCAPDRATPSPRTNRAGDPRRLPDWSFRPLGRHGSIRGGRRRQPRRRRATATIPRQARRSGVRRSDSRQMQVRRRASPLTSVTSGHNVPRPGYGAVRHATPKGPSGPASIWSAVLVHHMSCTEIGRPGAAHSPGSQHIQATDVNACKSPSSLPTAIISTSPFAEAPSIPQLPTGRKR